MHPDKLTRTPPSIVANITADNICLLREGPVLGQGAFVCNLAMFVICPNSKPLISIFIRLRRRG
jgi:hypothetical protein